VFGRSVDKISFVQKGRYVVIPMVATPGVEGRFVLNVGCSSRFTAVPCLPHDEPDRKELAMDARVVNGVAPSSLHRSTSSALAETQSRDVALQHLHSMVDMLRHELTALTQQRDQLQQAISHLDQT